MPWLSCHCFAVHIYQHDCENELEALTKDLANCKLQMEAKHAAYIQALRKVEYYQRLTSELSTLLKKSDTERNKHVNKCRDGRASMDELESMMKEMGDQHLGNAKFHEHFSRLLGELKVTQRQLLSKETELIVARDSELKALTKAEEMEIAFNIEKEKKEQLLLQVEELKRKKQTENQPMEAHNSSEKSAFNAINNWNQLHTDMGLKERKSMDPSVYIEALEMELNRLKQELVNAKKEVYGEGRSKFADVEAAEENNENSNNHITLPVKEYESLIRKVEKANEAQASTVEVGSQSEAALLKMELEAAKVKIEELRARAEQALRRAELAEKAKANLEEKIKRHKEKKQRRRTAMAALKEESTPNQFAASSSEATPKTYETLSKVLNLKF